MALCRFSDYQCDLYIFQSDRGIECYVAARRFENEPRPPATPTDADEEQWAQFWRDYGVHTAEIEAAQLLPIGLPADGAGETFGTWRDLLTHVLHLRSLGYQVPDWVIKEIQQEIEEEAA